ncbi:MAG: hypothetical protein AAFU73_14230 [Planctomycetota bacterium]
MLTRSLVVLAALLSLQGAAHAQCPLDDLFAPNHTCATAQPLNVTIVLVDVPLTITNDAPDYFHIPWDPGSELYVRAAFDGSAGDIDLELFDEFACDGAFPAASSTGGGDVESFTEPSFNPYVLKVSRSGPGTCSDYSLTILMERNSTDLGGTLCNGELNSVFTNATMSAGGSAAVADNDFRLFASGLPNNAFGLFLNSRGPGFTAVPGSQGFLCINDGAIGRFNRPGEIQSTGPTGFGLTLEVELTDLPRPNSIAAAAPGDRYAFQCWYRDVDASGNPTSNFTGAVAVWFE